MTDASGPSPEIHFEAIDRHGSSLADNGASGALLVFATALLIGTDLYRSATQHHFPSLAVLWFPTCAAQVLRSVRGEDRRRWPLSWNWAFSIYFAAVFAVALIYEPSRRTDWVFIALALLSLLGGLVRLSRGR
jgi:hypothetical protein